MSRTIRQQKHRIMRRVYTIWFVRRILPVFALELAIFAVVLFSVQSYMSFGAVLENAIVRAAQASYWSSTFTESELVVKLLLAALACVGALLLRDAVRISRGVRGNFLRLLGVTSYT